MATALRNYRLLPSALPLEEKRIRSSYVPTLLLVVVLSALVFVFLGINKGATSKSLIQFGLMLIPLVLYVAIWAPRRMKRRLIRCWETYDLEIGQDYLLRREADLPDLRVKFEEVQGIEHVPGRYLRVIGTPKNRVVGIPEGIEEFDEVLRTLSSVHAIRRRSIQQWQKYRAFMAAGLILYVTMLWSTSPFVVIALSLAMAATILWLFYWYRRNPNLSRTAKHLSWPYLPFLLVCALKLLVAVASFLPKPVH